MNVIPFIIYIIGFVVITIICEYRVRRIQEAAVETTTKMVKETIEFVGQCDLRWKKLQDETEEKIAECDDPFKNLKAAADLVMHMAVTANKEMNNETDIKTNDPEDKLKNVEAPDYD